MGHEPYLIRYDINNIKPIQKSNVLKKILKVLLVYPLVKSYRRKSMAKAENELKKANDIHNSKRCFEDFRSRNILSSKKLYENISELRNDPPLADAYIVGSDQVWAHLLDNPENEAMFLRFGAPEAKRISYAPSFSMVSYPPKLQEKLIESLSLFDSLSVREETGVSLCREIGFNAKVVLDPTLLLESSFYQSLLQAPSFENFIFVYHLNIYNQDEIAGSQLLSYALSNNQQVIATTASGYFQGRELLESAEYVYPTIPEWLGYIKYAKQVVTTSFHGVVFCLLFHTDFIYFPLKGKYERGNNRVFDLLSMVGLSDRIWSDSSTYEDITAQNINWHLVDKRLNEERAKSLMFLQESLR